MLNELNFLEFFTGVAVLTGGFTFMGVELFVVLYLLNTYARPMLANYLLN